LQPSLDRTHRLEVFVDLGLVGHTQPQAQILGVAQRLVEQAALVGGVARRQRATGGVLGAEQPFEDGSGAAAA